MHHLSLYFLYLSSLLCSYVSSYQPFTYGSLSVVRVGTSSLPSLSSTAVPVFIDEYDGDTGTLLQSIPFPSTSYAALNDNNPSTLYPLTLTVSDHLEGDLERSAEGCYLTLLGYGMEQGNSTVSLTKLLVAGMVNGNGSSIDTSTALNFTGNGYSRADGCVRSPLLPPGQDNNNYGAELFILAGQSSSCSLQLVQQNRTYLSNGTLITDGFAARGLSIAGEDPSTYQLYVGGGRIIRKIGNNGLNNLHSYVIGTPTIQGGNDFGAGWEFANDTLAYIIDKDDNYTDHQGGLHSVHVYTCQNNGDGTNNQCPEGGIWSRYGLATNFSYPCVLSPSGVKKDVWYLAGDYTVRGSTNQPIFYLTTDEGVGKSGVYKLDTATNECTLFIPPQPNVVYRGIAMSPSQQACLPPSPSPSPSSSPSPSPSTSPSSSSSSSSSPSTSPSPSHSFIPSNSNNVDDNTAGTNPSVAVGISFGVLLALVGLGGVIGRTLWMKGYITVDQKTIVRRRIRNMEDQVTRWINWVRDGNHGKGLSHNNEKVALLSSVSSSSSPVQKTISPNRSVSDARIRSLSLSTGGANNTLYISSNSNKDDEGGDNSKEEGKEDLEDGYGSHHRNMTQKNDPGDEEC